MLQVVGVGRCGGGIISSYFDGDPAEDPLGYLLVEYDRVNY